MIGGGLVGVGGGVGGGQCREAMTGQFPTFFFVVAVSLSATRKVSASLLLLPVSLSESIELCVTATASRICSP